MEAASAGRRDFDHLREHSIGLPAVAERIYAAEEPDAGFAAPVHGVEATT